MRTRTLEGVIGRQSKAVVQTIERSETWHEPGTTGWLMTFLEEKTRLMVETARKKNADYAGKAGDTDAFHNFTLVNKLRPSLSTTDGFFVRMCDKLARISSLLGNAEGPKVKDESLEDTLIDLANYSLLLAAYLQSQRLKESE